MKMNLETQPDRAPTHRRYWLDAKNQPQCADCHPPPDGVVVREVASTVDDKIYELEERLAIKNE